MVINWTPESGVEYWLFTATDPGLTAYNWTNLANEQHFIPAAAPFYMCGLNNGTEYYFAANGRINSGPGGPSSPTLGRIPYNASAVAWTPGVTTPAPNLLGVGYTSLTTCSNNTTSAAGSFAAVGAGGAIFTSSDGQTWANQSPPSGFATNLNAVSGYAANQNSPGNPALRWVAVGDGGASVYSLDGISWAVGNAYNASSPALRSLTQVARAFFAVGDAGTILSSYDGITWTSHTATSGTTNNLNGVTHGTTYYVAVGDAGTIVTSIDGNTWTAQTSGTTSNLRQVTSYGSIIVAAGDAGTIVTSIDNGATWTSQTLPGTPNLAGITSEYQLASNPVADPKLGYISTAQFVAVDSSGNAYTSQNGIDWSSAIPTGAASLNALVSSGFGYVATGNAGATASAF